MQATTDVSVTRADGGRTTARAFLGDILPSLLPAAASFVAHLLVAGNYGYFRDELYYLADGLHPQLGYVDQPPLIGWIATLLHAVGGDGLLAIHLVPALANAALIGATGLIARELGGGRVAQALAALAAALSPAFMVTGAIFSMDALDQLCWAICGYLVVRLLRRESPRTWVAFGLVAGIALTAKLTLLFFGLALTAALLVTPETRQSFRSYWLWLGGALALAFLTPYVAWEALNGFPTLEFWRYYGGLGTSRITFVVSQLLLMGPVGVLLAVDGVAFYFRGEDRRYRVIGWTVVILFAVLLIGGFKPYFLPPVFPLLFTPGALLFERALRRHADDGWWRRWWRFRYVALLSTVALLLAPLAMPILPPATFASRYGFLTALGNAGAGQQGGGSFPQYLADRFGWEALAATVARVYADLPAAERAHACVFTINYGEASALAVLGEREHRDLPPVISGHNNYYLWGPLGCDGAVLIAVGIHPEYAENQILGQAYGQRVQAATVACDYCVAEERAYPIYVYSQPLFTDFARDLWPRLKHFD